MNACPLLPILMLVLLLAFGCFLLWRFVCKVCSAALEAKDREIEQISKERDRYQALVL